MCYIHILNDSINISFNYKKYDIISSKFHTKNWRTKQSWYSTGYHLKYKYIQN